MQTSSAAQCIAVQAAAWRMSEVSPARYHHSRRYSQFAYQLLRFFAFHRTATADQVARYFPGQFRSSRSARMHLQTLARRGELTVLRTRGMGGINIYLITPQGLRSIANHTSQLTTGRRRRPSGSHLSHELLGTEAAVLLQGCVDPTRDHLLKILWEERFGFHHDACFQSLVPDYAFLVGHPSGQLIHFVEVSSGEDSSARLRDKLIAYANWAESDRAQQFLVELYQKNGASQPRPRFRLLFIIHHRPGFGDDLRIQQLVRAAAQAPETIRRRLWCTTATALVGVRSLNAPIWLRVNDLEQLIGNPMMQQSRDLQRQFIATQKKTPRQCLFPPG